MGNTCDSLVIAKRVGRLGGACFESLVNIAIIGSGISGLTAAYLLGRSHEVSLFEADDRLGGHAHTVDIDLDGRELSVDTGFIVYNERTYPKFCRLLSDLGVQTQPSDMSFSTTAPLDGVEYATHSLNALFARRQSLVDPKFYRMIQDILRFNRDSRQLLRLDSDAPLNLTLGRFLKSQAFSRRFVDHYILPMGAAIWSAAPDRFLDFPAATFVRFFDNHGLLDHRDHLPWRTITGGSRSYVEKLVRKSRAQFHTRSPVLGVDRSDQAVTLQLRDSSPRAFDHVVFACHSDTALSLLNDVTAQEDIVLGAIGYQTNEVLLHTDSTIMPTRRRAWASWTEFSILR